MLTIGGDCTGQDIGEILTEKEQQGTTPTKYFGIDYIWTMATFLGAVDSDRFKVVKIMRKSRRREILERNLTREQAMRVVNRYPDSSRSIVVFERQ